MSRLSERQQAILERLSDGALWNLYAWPLQVDPESIVETIHLLVASAILGAKGFVEIDEEDDETVWVSITPAGLAALQDAEQ